MTLRSDPGDPGDPVFKKLQAIGQEMPMAIDLGRGALYLAALEQAGISLDRYHNHLQKLEDETRDRHRGLLEAGAKDDVQTRLAALKHIIADKYEYTGDTDRYDDLQNASLIRVIDRRKGLPVALAILYIRTGRALGWDVEGLDFPGHFLCRIGLDGQRVIFDPFTNCTVLQAPELRQMIKHSLGEGAELSASHYHPADNRTILIRLQNNIKLRRIEAEDYEGALKTVQAMRAVDPHEYRLLLDEGVLYARTNRLQQAIDALAAYIGRAPDERDRQEAALLLEQLEDSLH